MSYVQLHVKQKGEKKGCLKMEDRSHGVILCPAVQTDMVALIFSVVLVVT